MRLRVVLFTMLLMTVAMSVEAVESFVIRDIKVEGLNRIATGTVLNYLPLEVGDAMDEDLSAKALRALFKTGFFDDISLSEEDGVLTVIVKERVSIAALKISGNEDIETEQLVSALKDIGLAEGRVFNRSALEKVEIELERQYFSQGKYAVKITSKVVPLEDNRVDIFIDIVEGDVSTIRQINIVGNKVYSEEDLLEMLQLTSSASWFSDDDQYSKFKLAADIETLRSHYLDTGYIEFAIESTQVSITPDKTDVYITINIDEGNQFTIGKVSLAGDLIVPEEELRSLVSVGTGDVFSRSKLSMSTSVISKRLGEEGFAFANVNAVPKIDSENKRVDLMIVVDPGKRVYVRRVNISGNLKTHDDVVRREVRQLEGGWISTEKINLSKLRLNRLGYLEDINVETPIVPGKDDQVDVNISVKEKPSGTLTAGLGYAQTQGLLINASISQNNFLGTGNRMSANVNNSSINTVYSFSYTDPYYTMDGVSRGFKGYFKKTDAGRANVGDYTTDVYGASINYGFPLEEFVTANLAVGAETTSINTTTFTPPSYLDFIANNGNEFDILSLSGGWSHDTRNRAIFADRGLYMNANAKVTMPFSGLKYYKLALRGLRYIPLGETFTMTAKASFGFGDSYGDTTELPFFEHYYGGGSQSVRGFRRNTLGPRENNRAIGGAFKATASSEIIFPLPFIETGSSFRMSAFVDAGNVFASVNSFKESELRYSTGLSAIWMTPIAPLTFSYSWPLNEKDTDSLERFQFTLGAFSF